MTTKEFCISWKPLQGDEDLRLPFPAKIVCGGLVIHRPVDPTCLGEDPPNLRPEPRRNAGWVISHAASGKRVCSADTLSPAKAAMEFLLDAATPVEGWSRPADAVRATEALAAAGRAVITLDGCF